jgi:hypothetical protein
MTGASDRSRRWQRYWDKKSGSYDKEMGFWDRHLFGLPQLGVLAGDRAGARGGGRHRAQPLGVLG